MKDESKTKKQLINELAELRKSAADAQCIADEIQQLKEINVKFVKAFIQNSIPAVITTLKEGRFVDVSDTFLKFIGLNRDEVIGKTSREIGFITEENRAIFFNELNKKGLVENLELPVRAKGGELRHGLFNAVMMSLHKEKYLLKVMTDITERNHLDEALRARNNYLSTILNTTQEGFGLFSHDGKIIEINDTMCSMHGYDRSELLTKRATDIIADEEPEITTSRLNRIRAGKAEIFESRHKRRDGSTFPLEISLNYTNVNGGLFFCFCRDITERKQTEEALRESEYRYRHLFDNIKSGIAIYNAINDGNDFVFADYNKSAEIIGGDKREDVVGKSVLAVYPGIKEFGLFEVFKRVWKTGKAEHHPVSLYQDHRLNKWFDNYVYKIPSGEIVVVFDDITNRHQMEKELRESEEKYRNILAGIEDGYFEVDLKGNLTFFNDALCRMSGYSREEFFGLNKKQFVDEKSAKIVFEKFHEVYTTGNPSKEFEWMAVSKEGTKHFLETSISLKRDSEGMPAGFYGIARNITNRRWIEEELRRSEERFRLIINNSKDVIWMLNMDLQFTFISPAIEQMVGYSVEEYLKKPHDEILLHDSIVRFLDVCTEELSRGNSLKSWKNQNQSRTFETEQIKKDGSKIWVEMTITFMRDNEGKPVGILGFSRDITNRKRMEEELLKARKLESVGTLAGGIAHDFNNLLAAIQGYVEMARINLPSETPVYNYLLAAEKSTHQAAELTKRLITFAQGGQPLKNNCDISQLIKNTVLEETIGKLVEKKLIIDDDLMKAIIDESHIRQVIRNLVINATEAMPEGGLLTVRAENIAVTSSNHLPLSEGPYVRISIADTGAGISVEDLPLIFDPYFSTKQRGSTKGMGLGLSVCHSIISKHQGCILVESAVGKGTTFNIYLPSITEEKTAKETPNQEGIPGIQKQILVMDDDAGVRDMISQLLHSMGFQVETAKDGLQTIDMYLKAMSSDQAYDMVILDLTVKGGMGGVQTMKRLLKIDPHVKAIIFSGYTDDEVIENYSQHGFLGALTKPFTKKELHSVLEKHL